MSDEVVPNSIQEYNNGAEELPNAVGHPCLQPQLVHESNIESNDYNPNQVPDPELDLLEKSIREDGLTMPIVTYHQDDGQYEIVDGFHRFLVLTGRLDEKWIPVSVIDKDIDERSSRRTLVRLKPAPTRVPITSPAGSRRTLVRLKHHAPGPVARMKPVPEERSCG